MYTEDIAHNQNDRSDLSHHPFNSPGADYLGQYHSLPPQHRFSYPFHTILRFESNGGGKYTCGQKNNPFV